MGNLNILVTGGAGFIGTHLVVALVEKGHQIRILDSLVEQVHGEKIPQHLNTETEFIKANVCDVGAVSKALKGIDVVYHLAAETGVGQSQYEIERYVTTNTLGTAVVLQEAANAKVKQVIITSSRAVYGEGLHNCLKCEKKFVPKPRKQENLDAGKWEIFCPICGEVAEAQLMSEEDLTMPTSIYGLTKLQQEQLAFQIGQSYGLPVTLLRLFNVFGPGQSLTNPYVGVLGTFFRRITSGNGIDIYEDGQMQRDFVYIGDVVKALNIVNNNESAFNQIINVGTGKVVTLQEAGEEVFRVLGIKPEMSFSGKYRLGDVHHAIADTKLIRDKLNFFPQTSFADGLREYLAWAKLNENNLSNIDLVAEQQLAEKNLLRQAKND